MCTAFAGGLNSPAMADDMGLRPSLDKASVQHLDEPLPLRGRLHEEPLDLQTMVSIVVDDVALHDKISNELSNQPDYLAALAAIDVAAGDSAFLIADLLPQIEGYIDQPLYVSTDEEDPTVGITASWTVFSADRKYKRESARALEMATHAEAQSVAASLALDASNARIDGMLLQRQIAVIDKRLARLRDLLQSTKARVAQGAASRAERERVNAELQSTTRQRADLAAALRKVKNDPIVGAWIGETAAAYDFEPKSILNEYTSEQLIHLAKVNSPDVNSRRHRLDAQDSQRRAARAEFLPKVRVNASWDTDLADPLDDNRYSVSARLSVPLFNPRNVVNTRYQDSLKARSLADYSKSIQSLERTIADNLDDRKGLLDSLGPAKNELASRRLIAKTSRARAKDGFSTIDAALNDQNDLDTVEINLLSIKAALAKIENSLLLAANIVP